MADIEATSSEVYWFVRGPDHLLMGVTEIGLFTSGGAAMVYGDEEYVADALAPYENELPSSKRKVRRLEILQQLINAGPEATVLLLSELEQLAFDDDFEIGFQKHQDKLKFHRPN